MVATSHQWFCSGCGSVSAKSASSRHKKNCNLYQEVEKGKRKPLPINMDTVTIHKVKIDNTTTQANKTAQMFLGDPYSLAQSEVENPKTANREAQRSIVVAELQRAQAHGDIGDQKNNHNNNNDTTLFMTTPGYFKNYVQKNILCCMCTRSFMTVVDVHAHLHYFRALVKCPTCKHSNVFVSADTGVNQQMVQAGLLSGMDYAEYSRLTALTGMNTMQKAQYYTYSDDIWNESSVVFESMLVDQLEKHFTLLLKSHNLPLPLELNSIINAFLGRHANQIDLGILMDFRWSQRRNALNGTLTVRSFGGIILDRVNVMRQISGTDSNAARNYIGHAKTMEGHAVQTFLDRVKKKNDDETSKFKINIVAFAHDQDGCTRNLILKLFPHAREFLDPGHAAKNVKKRVIHMAKGYGEKACVAFLKCVKTFPNATDRKYAMRAYPFHWTGDHRFCIGTGCKNAKYSCARDMLCKVTKTERQEIEAVFSSEQDDSEEANDDETQIDTEKTPDLEAVGNQALDDQLQDCTQSTPDLSPDKLLVLKKIFFEYSDRAASYKIGINTQLIEGGHNSMCILSNKRKYYGKSYPGRIDASFVRLEQGEAGLLEIMKAVGTTITEQMKQSTAKLDKNKETITEYKNSPIAKQRRKDDKKRKTNYAKNHNHPEYLYKEQSKPVTSSEQQISGKKQRNCSHCKQTGHDRRKCPKMTEADKKEHDAKVAKRKGKRKTSPIKAQSVPKRDRVK